MVHFLRICRIRINKCLFPQKTPDFRNHKYKSILPLPRRINHDDDGTKDGNQSIISDVGNFEVENVTNFSKNPSDSGYDNKLIRELHVT